MPSNPQAWTKFLSAKHLPPASMAGQSVVKNLLRSEMSYLQLANLANQDPVLSFYIMKEANAHKDRDAPNSKTLDHAISMIGVDRLKQVTQRLSPQSKVQKNENMQGFYYSRVLTVSLYAAHLAKELAHLKKMPQVEDIYWSALFLGVPFWYLWHFATPEMRLVRYAIRSNYKLSSAAEKEVLGCTVYDLAQAFIGAVKIPDHARECYDPAFIPSAREWLSLARLKGTSLKEYLEENKPLKMKLSQPSFVVLLANAIANDSSHCWYSRATLRSQRVLANWLGISLDDAIAICHESAVEASRQHPFPGVMLPAAKLFLPPRERVKSKPGEAPPEFSHKTVTLPASEPLQAKAATGGIDFEGKKFETRNIKPAPIQVEKKSEPLKVARTKGDRNVFNELTDIMLKTPHQFTDLHELMNAATQGIAYGLGFKRVTVALVNSQKTRLKAYYTVGTQKAQELGTFVVDLERPSLCAKLVEKPSSIWIKPDSSEKIKQMIPEALIKAGASNEFFLMSIFVNNKPVAIFYADTNDLEPLNEHDYKQFKYMCSTTTQCLYSLAQRRKQK